jgi:hypothetical protein
MFLRDVLGKTMIPSGPDFVAMALQIGNYMREIGLFIAFGAVVAAAQITLLGRRSGPWSGERIIAPIAAIPVGFAYVIVAALRSALIFQTASLSGTDPAAAEPGVLRRAVRYVEDLIFPFLISAAIGAVLVVLTPTEPLWTLLSGDAPWRFLIAPLIAGMIKPRGGTEIPLVLALMTKGLDPAGAIAAIAGAGYLHARSLPLGAIHIAFGAALGFLFSITGLI